MILRVLPCVAAAVLCSGCFGFLVDKPFTTEIQHPMPNKAPNLPPGRDRWAVESYPTSPLTKDHFLAAWGVPREKLTTPKGETWIYAENARWCGLWVAFVVPIPLLLPVCETYDRVAFEGDAAVRS